MNTATGPEHLDFDIEISEAAGGRYPVAVLGSPAGEARETMVFPYDELALQNRLQAVTIALLSSGRGRRRVAPPEEEAVREFGGTLFQALFSGEVGRLFDVSRAEARSRGAALRVKLRCRAPELAVLPWEFLYDPGSGEYLCLSRLTPLVRYLEVPSPMEPLRVDLPLRVLGVVSSPRNLPALDVGREKQRIEEALADLVASGAVVLSWLAEPTWRHLQQALNRERWHVFHFVGHGEFDQRAQQGVLAFCDESGNAHLLGARDVGILLGDHHTLRLAVLNACEGARGGATDVFSSTAAELVRRGTPGVVAMQYQITDLAAIELARSFYDAVATGLPVDTALAEARKALCLGLSGTLEWGTPVLFMRAPDGVLFDVTTPPSAVRTPPLPPPPPEPAQPPAPAPQPAAGPPYWGSIPKRAALAVVAIGTLLAVFFIVWVAAGDGDGSEENGSEPVLTGGRFAEPEAIAITRAGDLLVGDNGHHSVVRVRPDGTTTVVAGVPEIDAPWAVAEGPGGEVYIADHGTHVIHRVVRRTIDTLPVELATGIELDGIGMATDGRLLYVSSDNRSSDNRVYRIGPGMNAVLFAGTGVQGYAGDRGPATAAQFDDPNGLAVGPDHALYVADGGNGRIRRIATDLTVSTVAGGGTGRPIDGDSATKPELAHPADVAFDGTGNLYILESGSQAIRKVTPDGRIWTIVPPHQPGFAGDGGSAKQARFGGNLEDFAVAPDGTIYVLDRGNSRLRRITPQGIISTVR